MPFETVPFLHGRFFSYHQYFVFLGSCGLCVWALVCAAFGLWIRLRSMHAGQQRGSGRRQNYAADALRTDDKASLASGPTQDSVTSVDSTELTNVEPSVPSMGHMEDLQPTVGQELAGRQWLAMLVYGALGMGGFLVVVLFIIVGIGDYPQLVSGVAILFLAVPSAVVVGFSPKTFTGADSVFFALAALHVASISVIFSYFGYLNVGVSCFVFMLCLAFCLRGAKGREFEASWNWWVLAVAGALVVSGAANFAGWDMCVSLYTIGSQGTVISVLSSAFVSTRWSRKNYACRQGVDPGMPCHLYLTLADDASSSVFVNVHMPPGSKPCGRGERGGDDGNGIVQRVYAICETWQGQVCGSKLVASSGSAASAYCLSHDYLNEGRRDVYSAFLDGLQAGVHYRLILEVAGKNLSSLPHWRFRTAPPHNESVELVFGGDMGSSDDVSKLMAVSLGPKKSAGPAAVVIGGDIAYDNGMATCWCVWEDWLDRWDAAQVNAQRLVPLVFAVGNHDVGISAVANVVPPYVDKTMLPYFTFFPFSAVHGDVPSVAERESHHVHRIGNTLVISLDSGYMEGSDAKSLQIAWADKVFQADLNSHIPAAAVFPTYHVPIYPSSMEHYHDFGAGASGAFAPLFDSYGVHIAFENHVHAFKRTKPLKNNKVDQSGTVYLGDGRAGLHGLGVPHEAGLVDASEEPRLAVNCLAKEHIWHVKVSQVGTLNGFNAVVNALDVDGKSFDSFSRSLRPPSAQPQQVLDDVVIQT